MWFVGSICTYQCRLHHIGTLIAFKPFYWNYRTCFKRKRYLRTENFMDPNKRIHQAREFFGLMMELNFNPDMSCFRDNYYLYQFPEQFYRGPKKYIDGFFKKTSLSQGFWSNNTKTLHLSLHKVIALDIITKTTKQGKFYEIRPLSCLFFHSPFTDNAWYLKSQTR